MNHIWIVLIAAVFQLQGCNSKYLPEKGKINVVYTSGNIQETLNDSMSASVVEKINGILKSIQNLSSNVARFVGSLLGRSDVEMDRAPDIEDEDDDEDDEVLLEIWPELKEAPKIDDVQPVTSGVKPLKDSIGVGESDSSNINPPPNQPSDIKENLQKDLKVADGTVDDVKPDDFVDSSEIKHVQPVTSGVKPLKGSEDSDNSDIHPSSNEPSEIKEDNHSEDLEDEEENSQSSSPEQKATSQQIDSHDDNDDHLIDTLDSTKKAEEAEIAQTENPMNTPEKSEESLGSYAQAAESLGEPGDDMDSYEKMRVEDSEDESKDLDKEDI